MVRWTTVGALAMVLAMHGSALAQSPEALAQHDVNAGAKHYNAGQFHEAYLRFKSAAAVYPSPHVRANLVRSGARSTYPQERVDSAREGRALVREGKLVGEDATNVRTALEQLQGSVAHVEVRGAKDAVQIDGSAIDAALLAEPYDVLPGKHEVVVGSEHHTVDVAIGATIVVTVGQTETATKPADAGHTVAPPRDTRRVPRDGRPIVVGVLGGLAVASLGTGLTTFLVGSSARNDAKDAAASPTDRDDARGRANTMRTVSTITTYAGIGLGVVAVIPLLVWPKKTVTVGGAQVTPVLGAGSLGLNGSF